MSKRLSALLAVGSAMTALFLYAAPAQAQATRTWVSGVGDDVNPCSRTAPCKTFAGAISKTALNGEINCLDPAGYGTVTITKSITIDCKNTHGSILNASVNGINIPFDNFTAVGETRKSVRIRGLALNGADTGTNGIRITGNNTAGTEVFVEDTVMDGNFGGTARGISDERSGGGKLYVTNTTIRNMGGRGISVFPTLGAAATGVVQVIISDSRIQSTLAGVLLSFKTSAIVSRSVISGNDFGVFVEGDGTANSGSVNVSDSVITHNGVGIQANSGVARLSSSDIVYNATGFSGATTSHGNNRILGNTAVGTTPTIASPALQ
ncbi:MAG TPA: hypothetical protein VHP37_09505 [Burkholderiales bacterium]|nr:hypothetical protein [Burkholderiales bacterium]